MADASHSTDLISQAVVCLGAAAIAVGFAAVTITRIFRANFPLAKLPLRAYDRRHAIWLMAHETDPGVRETCGCTTLELRGLTAETRDMIDKAAAR